MSEEETPTGEEANANPETPEGAAEGMAATEGEDGAEKADLETLTEDENTSNDDHPISKVGTAAGPSELHALQLTYYTRSP